MPTLKVANDQRVGAIGRTGSGKTYLMQYLLSQQPRVIVVDSKHRVRWPGYSMTVDADAALIPDRVIYRPQDKVPGQFWDNALDKLHDAGGGIVYCDELAEVTSPSFAPTGLKTIFRLGREIGVGCFWSAQEATAINNVCIRQSDVLCLFMNTGASDRDKLIATTGDIGEVTAHLNFYEFAVFQATGDDVVAPNEIPTYRVSA